MWVFFKICPHVMVCGYVCLENTLRLLLENKHFRLCGHDGSRVSPSTPSSAVIVDADSASCASCFSCFLGLSRCRGCACRERTDYPLSVCLLAAARLTYWCIIHIDHAMLVEPFSDKNYAEFVCDLLFSSFLLVLMAVACNTKAILWFLIQGFVIVVCFGVTAGLLEKLPAGASAPLPSNPGYWARWIVQPTVHIFFLCLGMCLSHLCCERAREKKRQVRRGAIERLGVEREDTRGLRLVRKEQLVGRIWFRVLVLCLDLICVLRCVDIVYVLNSDAMHAVLDAFLSALLLVVHFQKNVSSMDVYKQYVVQGVEQEIAAAEMGQDSSDLERSNAN